MQAVGTPVGSIEAALEGKPVDTGSPRATVGYWNKQVVVAGHIAAVTYLPSESCREELATAFDGRGSRRAPDRFPVTSDPDHWWD